MENRIRTPIKFETAFSNYEASSIIGEGGSCRVYRAADEDGRFFAIKVLAIDKTNSEKIKRFKNELFICLRFKHDNIIAVHDYGVYHENSHSEPFYVMSLYGASLRKMITDGIEQDKVLDYYSQVLKGIQYAHQKEIVHRDLKPENILYDSDNDRLIVADFGIAHFREEDLFTAVETQDDRRLANFQYAAPEQKIRGQRDDYRADIYALGLILNEMFTHKIPYGSGYETIGKVNSQFSYLDELVDMMIRQSPIERPASIEEVMLELFTRRELFLTSQHIKDLKEADIQVSEIKDPLIVDPVFLIDRDWKDNLLTLILSQPVNSKWINIFREGQYSHGSLIGRGPERFTFENDKAHVKAEVDEVQRIIDYYKRWLPDVNRLYEQAIRQEHKVEEDRLRREKQEAIKKQEERERVLRETKI